MDIYEADRQTVAVKLYEWGIQDAAIHAHYQGSLDLLGLDLTLRVIEIRGQDALCAIQSGKRDPLLTPDELDTYVMDNINAAPSLRLPLKARVGNACRFLYRAGCDASEMAGRGVDRVGDWVDHLFARVFWWLILLTVLYLGGHGVYAFGRLKGWF